MKPFIKWAGGKSQLADEILRYVRGRKYIEPFVGGGAVYSRLRPENAILSDVNEDLISAYEAIKKSPEELMRAIDTLSFGKNEFYEIRARRPTGFIARGARLVYLNKSCFNGLWRVNSKGEFNVPFGQKKNRPAMYDRENILAWHEALQGTTISVADFADTMLVADSDTTIYCDPPYVPETPTSFVNYSTSWAHDDHQRLIDAARAAHEKGAVVIISNSMAAAPLYTGFDIVEVETRRRISKNAAGRGTVKEIIAILR